MKMEFVTVEISAIAYVGEKSVRLRFPNGDTDFCPRSNLRTKFDRDLEEGDVNVDVQEIDIVKWFVEEKGWEYK